MGAPQTSRDRRWSETLRRQWLACWGCAWHISSCASRDRRWSETLQWRRLPQWGWRWALVTHQVGPDDPGDVPKGRARLGVCAECTQRWAVTKMRLRVGFSSSLDDTSPRTDGSKETSVEATRAAPCQQQVLLHSRTALGMQLSMRRVCGDGAVDVGGTGGGSGARRRHGAIRARGSARMVSMAPGDVPKCMSTSPCML